MWHIPSLPSGDNERQTVAVANGGKRRLPTEGLKPVKRGTHWQQPNGTALRRGAVDAGMAAGEDGAAPFSLSRGDACYVPPAVAASAVRRAGDRLRGSPRPHRPRR